MTKKESPTNKFEFKIVPDNRTIPIAVSAQEYARYCFKNEKDTKAIDMALEEAIANITEYLSGNRAYHILITSDSADGDLLLPWLIRICPAIGRPC